MSDEVKRSGGRSTVQVESRATEQDDAARQRQQVLALLRGRYHWAVLLALLFGVTAAVVGYMAVTPVYRSSGRVQVAPELSPVLSETDATAPIRDYYGYLAEQAGLIKSPAVVELAMRQEVWQQTGRSSSPTQAPIFAANLEVELPRRNQGQSVWVSFRDVDPEVAQAGVRAVLDAYRQIYEEDLRQAEAQRLGTLERSRSRVRQELNTIRGQKQQLLGDLGAQGLAERFQVRTDELLRLNATIEQLKMRLDAMDGRSSAVPQQLDLDQMAASDPLLADLVQRKRLYESSIQRDLQLGLGIGHRQVARAQAELDSMNRQIEDHMRRYPQGGLASGAPVGSMMGPEASRDDLTAELERLEEAARRVESEVREMVRRTNGAQELDAEALRLQQRLTQIDQRMEELRIEARGAERLRVLSYGSETKTPYNDSTRKQLAAAGFVGGGSLGVGLVMLFGLLDRRFRRLDDAQLTMPDTRVLGILPTLSETLADPERVAVAAHCVHQIRTVLQIDRDDERGVYAITSPAPGSGKTSLTTALGLSFATSESRTLLIDCDVVGGGLTRRMRAVARRSLEQILLRHEMVSEREMAEAKQRLNGHGGDPGQTLVTMGYLSSEDLERARHLQRESSVGLLEALDGEPLERCVTSTGVKNLDILPLGTALPHQAGSLSPAAVRRLVAQARERYDTVVIDTGPILGSIEASMAGAEADSTVLVVSRGDQKAMVSKSLENLNAVGANVRGIVFNHATADDVERSSYASVTSGPARSPNERARLELLDATATAKFGPVGAAVACCTRTGEAAMMNLSQGEPPAVGAARE